ncbi:MAG: DUF1003 domain-containing protein [Tissierellia bacterium]|nr:DUF1003 domain-containing protein [Tissierellia bacterium]
MRHNNHERVKKILAEIKKDSLNDELMELVLDTTLSKQESEMNKKETFSQKAADAVAAFVGSWTFIIFFAVTLISWMSLNVYFLHRAFDPYPFILLNLVLSCLAAVQAPLIMMSQNRQEDIDRIRSENDYKVNLKTEIVIEEIYYKLATLEKEHKELKKYLASHFDDENRI